MELRLRLTRRRVAVAALLVGLVSAGVAYATIPDANGVFTACMLNKLGTIRIIDPATQRCSASLETQITWNQGAAGAKGPTGDQGPVGDKGPTGDKGPNGDPGPAGDKGASGDKGAVGDKGPAGDKGPTGDPGVSGLIRVRATMASDGTSFHLDATNVPGTTVTLGGLEGLAIVHFPSTMDLSSCDTFSEYMTYPAVTDSAVRIDKHSVVVRAFAVDRSGTAIGTDFKLLVVC